MTRRRDPVKQAAGRIGGNRRKETTTYEQRRAWGLQGALKQHGRKVRPEYDALIEYTEKHCSREQQEFILEIIQKSIQELLTTVLPPSPQKVR